MDYVTAGRIVPVPIAVNPRGEFVEERFRKFSLRALLYHNLSAHWAMPSAPRGWCCTATLGQSFSAAMRP